MIASPEAVNGISEKEAPLYMLLAGKAASAIYKKGVS